MIKNVLVLFLLFVCSCVPNNKNMENDKTISCDRFYMNTHESILFDHILINLIMTNSNTVYDDIKIRSRVADDACQVFRQYKLTVKENF